MPHDSIKDQNQGKQACYVGISRKKHKEMMNINFRMVVTSDEEGGR